MKITAIYIMTKNPKNIYVYIEFDDIYIQTFKIDNKDKIAQKLYQYSTKNNEDFETLKNKIKYLPYSSKMELKLNKLVLQSQYYWQNKYKNKAYLGTILSLIAIKNITEKIRIGNILSEIDFKTMGNLFNLQISFFLLSVILENVKNHEFKKIANIKSKLYNFGLSFLAIVNFLGFLESNGLDMKYLKNKEFIQEIEEENLDDLIATENQSEEQIRLAKIDKIFQEIQNNPYISSEDIEYIMKIKKYFQDNRYIDLNKMYNDLPTMRIYDLYNLNSNIRGVHFRDNNSIAVYKPLDKAEEMAREEIIIHENIHHTGSFSSELLNEGITTCLEIEYCNYDYNEILKIHGHASKALAVRFITYLVGTDVVLEAYSKENDEILYQALDQIFIDRNTTKQLLVVLNNYDTNFYNLTRNDLLEIENVLRKSNLNENEITSSLSYLIINQHPEYLFNVDSIKQKLIYY